MMLVFVPFGWLAGKGIYRLTVVLIPDTLRSYPIVAFLWAALLPGAMIVLLYDPAPGLGAKVFWVWVAAQLPAMLLIAGLYGIVEGWLAVPGAFSCGRRICRRWRSARSMRPRFSVLTTSRPRR